MNLSNNRNMALLSLLFLIALASKTFAWTSSMDFEQGTIGQQAEGSSGFVNAFTQTLYSNEVVHGGTKSAKVSFSSGSDGGESGGEISHPAKIGGEGSEMWARGYFYFKSSWSWKCSPVVKIFRPARILSSSGGNVGFLSIFADSNGKIVMSNEAGDFQDYYSTTSFDLDKWQSIEMYVKLSTTQPIFRIWKNGILIKEDTTHKTLRSSSDYGETLAYVFSYWNGGIPQNQVGYIDDFVFTTTRPSNQDANGNYMIGPSNSVPSTPATVPSSPRDLIVK